MPRLFPDYRAAWETEQHRELRRHTAEFLKKESTPHQQRWARQNMVDRELWAKAGAAGLLGVELPPEFGGAGGDFGLCAVIAEELPLAHDSSFGWIVHTPITAHYIDSYAAADRRRAWLPGIIGGELVLAIAMTEPGTGSDLQAVRTTAVRDGDHYVVNGSKTFISNATHCDLLVIVAKTDTSQGASGVSLIVAETRELPGFERGRILEKIGQHGQDTRELFFSDMRVPVSNLLGDREGLGFVQLMEQLPRERLIIAAMCVGMAEAAVLEAIRYAKDRHAFGRPLIKFQHTKFELAELKSEVLAIKTLVDHAIGRYIEGDRDQALASIAKLQAADRAVTVVDRAVQIFGGYGYMAEYPIARMYAAARVNKVYGGTSEIMKEIISRTL